MFIYRKEKWKIHIKHPRSYLPDIYFWQSWSRSWAFKLHLSTLCLSPTPISSTPLGPGSVMYMAPELIQGAEPNVLSDLWALGCVLYEMFAGEKSSSSSATTPCGVKVSIANSITGVFVQDGVVSPMLHLRMGSFILHLVWSLLFKLFGLGGPTTGMLFGSLKHASPLINDIYCIVSH